MRRLIIASLVCGFCVTAPVLATAQGRVPHKESTALGFDVGALMPRSDLLGSAGLMSVNYDYYVTPRVSLRGSFGWANQEFDTSGPDSLRQMPLRLDVNYNWEGGEWHPFVGAGLGAYFMQFRDNGQTIGDTETKLGLNLGGGVEYFFNRAVAFKGEGRYHAIPKVRGIQPSGLAITAGLKTYF
jgi:opacity protein-like surface antigen